MNNRLLREPLLHFAAAGALLFALSAIFQHGDGSSGDEIRISQSRIDHLAAVFARGWQRPPTAAELQGLVDDYVRGEVLYREAIKLGLDRDDTVIRRRLRLKMELLAEDLADAVDPGKQALQRYFADHRQDYLHPARLSFRQIYFNSDRRGAAGANARAALARLRGGDNAADIGDSSALRQRYTDESAGRIDRVFGDGFSARLRELPRGRWSGPVRSAYGQHLVYIETFTPRRPAEFTDVQPQVLRDWRQQQQKDLLQRQYLTLRAKYHIHVDGEIRGATSEVARQ
ncbi:peptidylprolyl isomerase [Microbulbifer sp. SAOS-129_SWC]|uniref:peptidylprolyl isomerase n=1 Tax=Microbulbifer sp. SAOS-129_SWC TaxID=3145235 RepID=UPI003216A9D4